MIIFSFLHKNSSNKEIVPIKKVFYVAYLLQEKWNSELQDLLNHTIIKLFGYLIIYMKTRIF